MIKLKLQYIPATMFKKHLSLNNILFTRVGRTNLTIEVENTPVVRQIIRDVRTEYGFDSITILELLN